MTRIRTRSPSASASATPSSARRCSSSPTREMIAAAVEAGILGAMPPQPPHARGLPRGSPGGSARDGQALRDQPTIASTDPERLEHDFETCLEFACR